MKIFDFSWSRSVHVRRQGVAEGMEKRGYKRGEGEQLKFFLK